MSVKRQATKELTHDNWDQDDPDDHEEMGTFKVASHDVIEKRVIRTARRRAQNPEVKKGVFSAFGGFSKAPTSSFDFLANLTNGTKPANGSPANKTETSVPSSSPSGLFSVPVSSSPKLNFGMSTAQSSVFGGQKTSSSLTSSDFFSGTKADPTVGGFSFKTQTTTDTSNTKTTTPSIFGSPKAGMDIKNTLFSTTASSSPFKIQPETNTGNEAPETKHSEDDTEKSDKKITYYTKLKGLNESVSDWIKKHVEKTPLCILSPIFKDYEKYLKEIKEEYEGPASEGPSEKISTSNNNTANLKLESESINLPPSSNSNSLFSNTAQSKSPFSAQSFGLKLASPSSTSSNATTTITTSGFSFGSNNTSPQSSITGTSAPSAPFSFGIGKPFSISNFNAPKPNETENASNEDEDEPPKVEFNPVVEKDSIYDIKCKIFVKKDSNFVDKGVGTLYIKKIPESGKHQLLVRANTNLGNIMLNLVLAEAIPTQRMGKNNVMMVCIPTPDAKPPPTSILIRVKTSEEADQLLETLNKYKG